MRGDTPPKYLAPSVKVFNNKKNLRIVLIYEHSMSGVIIRELGQNSHFSVKSKVVWRSNPSHIGNSFILFSVLMFLLTFS